MLGWWMSKLAATTIQKVVLLGVVGAFATGFVVVYANITATDFGGGDEPIRLGVNTFITDPDTTIQNSDVTIVTSSAGASAGEPGVEADVATFPAVNNVLTAGNYAYTVEVIESGIDTWTAGEDHRIRVYGHNNTGPAVTLLATLYFQQASANATTVEGVTVTVDIGLTTAIHDHYDIIVDRQ